MAWSNRPREIKPPTNYERKTVEQWKAELPKVQARITAAEDSGTLHRACERKKSIELAIYLLETAPKFNTEETK